MNANRKLASHLFASALRDALADGQGRLPSAAKFADAFNLRAHGTSTITRETARKWLKGEAMPEIGKMQALIHWLNLDPAVFLQPPATDGNAMRDYGEASGSDGADVREALAGILSQLDDRSVEALYLTATAMQALKNMEKQAGAARASDQGFNRQQVY